jgi:hypothetical protein
VELSALVTRASVMREPVAGRSDRRSIEGTAIGDATTMIDVSALVDRVHRALLACRRNASRRLFAGPSATSASTV